jgi:hypothetical protein
LEGRVLAVACGVVSFNAILLAAVVGLAAFPLVVPRAVRLAAAMAMGLALAGMHSLFAAAFAAGASELVRIAILALLVAAGLAV